MNKKKIRERFRNEVLSRDNFKCKVCGIDGVNLDPHHIIDRSLMPNQGMVKENGITLCDRENGCHLKAEQYHLGNEVQTGFYPDDLYKLIGSSYETAYKKSISL